MGRKKIFDKRICVYITETDMELLKYLKFQYNEKTISDVVRRLIYDKLEQIKNNT